MQYQHPISSFRTRRREKERARLQDPSRPRTSSWRLPLTGVLGLMLIVVSCYLGNSNGPWWIFALGVVCAVGGLLTRIWATGWLVKNALLITGGPYRMTRNPLYFGTFLILIGQSLMSGVPWTVLLFPPLCLALYWPTMVEESKFLRKCHGEEYDAYASRVPMFFPRWRASGVMLQAPSTQEFSWQRIQRCWKGFLANALLISIYAILHQIR